MNEITKDIKSWVWGPQELEDGFVHRVFRCWFLYWQRVECRSHQWYCSFYEVSPVTIFCKHSSLLPSDWLIKSWTSQLAGQERLGWNFWSQLQGPKGDERVERTRRRRGCEETIWRDQEVSPWDHHDGVTRMTLLHQSEPGKGQMASNRAFVWVLADPGNSSC